MSDRIASRSREALPTSTPTIPRSSQFAVRPVRRSDRALEGRATGSLLLLLVLLVGVGGWNYHRNWQIERQVEGRRPYAGYAVADLSALKSAYSEELEAMQARFERARGRRARPVRDLGSIADHVEQFEKTARASSAIREAAAEVAERQRQIAELDRELEIRSRFGEGLTRHLKRLTRI
ncbi:MAG: hypothetical protein ACX98W_07675 [bacterium]